MVFTVEAVRIGKVAVFHAQRLGFLVHFLYKNLHRIRSRQGFVLCQLSAGGYRRHLGSVIAAGQHHGGDQLLYCQAVTFLKICHGGVLLNQCHGIAYHHRFGGIHVLQQNPDRQQLCDAGRIELFIHIPQGGQIFSLPHIIGKVFLCCEDTLGTCLGIAPLGYGFRRRFRFRGQVFRLFRCSRFCGRIGSNGDSAALLDHRIPEPVQKAFGQKDHTAAYQHHKGQNDDFDFYNGFHSRTSGANLLSLSVYYRKTLCASIGFLLNSIVP